MFKDNVVEYGGTRIEYNPVTRTFLFRSFWDKNGKVELLECGSFRVFEPYTTIMSNGSHRGVREIVVINDKLWGGVTKVQFNLLPDDFKSEHIDDLINALKEKAKAAL